MNRSVSFAKKNRGITPSSFSTLEEMKDVEFLVPLYQRLFVWEEEQINQFFEDLERAYHADPSKPYYIGTLTVYRDPKESSIWELVDGQQRMTVLTLFGLACSHKWEDNFLWTPFLVRRQESRLRYFARRFDQDDLNTLRRSFNADRITNANMKRFIDVFERFARRTDLSSEFSKFVFEKTTALVAFLPDSYKLNDLNLYFEKMNSGGKQLEAHEILKGRFGAYSAKWNAIADVSKRFGSVQEETQSLVDLTLKDLLADGADLTSNDRREPSSEAIIADTSRLVMSFPIFLLHSLSICIEPNVEKEIVEEGFWESKHLLSTFKRAETWWSGNRKEKTFADSFFDAMEAYRKWMDRWIIHIEDGRPMSPYQQVDRYDVRVDQACEKPLWQFQSMLYVSGGERQGWVLDAYQADLKNQFKEEGGEVFLVMLKRQDEERHRLNVMDDDSLEFSYGQIDRYWFWKLDYILWEKAFKKEQFRGFDDKQVSAIMSYTFRRNRSIEHLHPQTSKTAWDEKSLHSFGNLAMISASFNSQQGNDSVGTKFGRMGDKIAKKELESVKLLFMFVAANGKDDQWTPDASKEHCHKMINVLKSYYGITPPA